MATNNIAARLLSDLKRDFGLTDAQAAGVVGNLMYESGGFNSLQEIQPTVPGSRGGYGYAQWTGPRRNAFEGYAKSNNLDPSSYEANYGFLKHEIETDPYERRQFNTVKKAKTAEEAARIVSDNFLRPGIPNVPARQQLAAQAMGYSNMPIPPAEIPNVVASRTDTTPQTRDVPRPVPRPAMGGDPGGGGIGTLVARVNPATGQTDSFRDVPPPRPRPIMGGDPGGGGLGELVATIPSTQPLPPQRLPDLPPSTLASPRMVEASHDRANAAVDPVLRLAMASRPASANPLDEYNRLRGNPAIAAPSMAALQPEVPGPSIGYAKDQSRLSPSSIGMVGSGVAGLTSTAPIMVGMANPRMPPPPRPRPDRQVAPQAQQQRPMVAMAQPVGRAPLQAVVQGANSYGNSGGRATGSSTGRSYNTGQSYQSAGYNYQFNNDGSVTNTDTGITRGGNRRSYDPDTNTWG